MATGVKFAQFNLDLGLKVHNLNTDTLKIMLSNTAPSATTGQVKADITEISAGNGYTAGGADSQNTFSLVSGVGTMVCTDVVLTASGGAIGPFRWAVVYNDTPSSPAKPLVAFWDVGAQTVNDGESVTLDFASTSITIT